MGEEGRQAACLQDADEIYVSNDFPIHDQRNFGVSIFARGTLRRRKSQISSSNKKSKLLLNSDLRVSYAWTIYYLLTSQCACLSSMKILLFSLPQPLVTMILNIISPCISGRDSELEPELGALEHTISQKSRSQGPKKIIAGARSQIKLFIGVGAYFCV